MFLQSRNCSKEILTSIIIPPWFQAYIYWKKFVSWRHHFQPSIFSMIVSLFHGSTWRNPHVKETVFISQYFLQPSIIIKPSVVDSRNSWFISEKALWRLSYKGAYLFHRTSCNNFFLRSTVLNAQKYLQRFQSFMVNQHSEITLKYPKILKHSAVSKG